MPLLLSNHQRDLRLLCCLRLEERREAGGDGGRGAEWSAVLGGADFP